MEAYVNADIHGLDEVMHDHALLVKDHHIVSIVEHSRIPPGYRNINLKGRNIAAGFVDLQVNGGGGVLFNSDYSRSSVLKALEAHQRLGTTSMFPTVFTSSFESMEGLLGTVVELRAGGHSGIAGIHFEGPIIEEGKAGVHDRERISAADGRLLELFRHAAKLVPTLVTLAPEKVDDVVISDLRNSGALVFAGHTNASYDRMQQAFTAGLQGGTHLFNAMSPFTSREPGVTGSIMANEKAFASIIVDGHHVHWASVRAAWRAMGKRKLFAVTDAMPCVGSDLEAFQLGSLEVHVRNGRCETADGTLAGSCLDMATAVRNLVQHVGVPLPEALKMANEYPCQFAGLQDAGRLESGRRADFVVFDNQLNDLSVYVGGKATASHRAVHPR